MAETAQATITRASALTGLSDADHRLVTIRLLADLLLALDPMADVSVSAVISRAQAAGYTGLPKDVHRILQSQLLADLVAAGGVGGGTLTPTSNLVAASDSTQWRLTLTKTGPGATADNYILDWVAP